VVAYNASFECGVLTGLAACCPDLAAPILDLRSRVVDLLPVVRNHVYHPAFGGSFGLKAVLPALVGQGYDDLVFGDGGAASRALERLLFEPPAGDEREALRRDLLAYCARDTWGLVLLLRRLRELAA
jgi:predicted RecB family nuclease